MKVLVWVKNGFVNLALLSVTILLAVLAAECFCRYKFEAVDYLMPELIADEVLGHRIAPHSAGHDAWGYRNKTVPETAGLVAIGDSQTYGIAATAEHAWPAHLARNMNQPVYNLALGGYGVAEYYYLLEQRGLALRPHTIIVGLYYGNDLFDTYRAVYVNDHWKDFRKAEFEVAPETRGTSEENNPRLAALSVRGWLSRHSILYRLLVHSPMGAWAQRLETKANKLAAEQHTSFSDSEHKIYTAFVPAQRLSAVNLDKPKIREGLRLSLAFIERMQARCREANVRLVVALIPTKESVFARYIEHNTALNDSEAIAALLMNEGCVNTIVKSALAAQGIAHLDLLPALQNAAGTEQIYPNNENGHPNEKGYAVIAKSLQEYLKENTLTGQARATAWPLH